MFTKLTLLAGANFISQADSISQQVDEKNLAQLSTQNEAGEYDVFDPEYYDEANVMAKYEHDPRFRQNEFYYLHQQHMRSNPRRYGWGYQRQPQQHLAQEHTWHHARHRHKSRAQLRHEHQMRQRERHRQEHKNRHKHRSHKNSKKKNMDFDEEAIKPSHHTQTTDGDDSDNINRTNAYNKNPLLKATKHLADDPDKIEMNMRELFEELQKDLHIADRYEPSTIRDEDYHPENEIHKLFHNFYDHDTYNQANNEADMEKIKVLSHGQPNKYFETQGLGRRCEPQDFVALHWIAKYDDGGHPRQVENSFTRFGEDKPLYVQQGEFKNHKCWDLSLVNMHVGEKMEITCPAYLAHGKHSFYVDSKDGDDFQVPADSPLIYTLSVIDCENHKRDVEANVKKFQARLAAKRKAKEAEEAKKEEEEKKQQEAEEAQEKIKEAAEAIKKKKKADQKKAMKDAGVEDPNASDDDEDQKEEQKKQEKKAEKAKKKEEKKPAPADDDEEEKAPKKEEVKEKVTKQEEEEKEADDDHTEEPKKSGHIQEDEKQAKKDERKLDKAKEEMKKLKKEVKAEEDKEQQAEQEAEKEEEEAEKNPEAPVNADKMAEKNAKVFEEKAIVDDEKKAVKKMDKKVDKAQKALKKEEDEIKVEAKAEGKVQKEVEKKKEEDDQAHPWKTDPAKDVDIISSHLKKKCAGTYQKSVDLTIHAHPVWIKVQPQQTRIGYYQQKRWIITDLANLQPMLDDAGKDPEHQWKNAFVTSLNEVEDFPSAIWKDDKNHHLKPKTISDNKVECSYEEPKLDSKEANNDEDEEPQKKEEKEEEPVKEEKKEEEKEEQEQAPTPAPKKEDSEEEAAPAPAAKPKAKAPAAAAPEPKKPSDVGAKATKAHEQVAAAKVVAEKKVKKAVDKIQKEKARVTEPKEAKLKAIANKKPKGFKPMGSARCFIITFDSPAGLVLQVDPFDKYRPRKTGVYNVHLASLMADKPLKDPERKLQLWYYNAKRRALLNWRYPSKGLFEGFNKNLIVFKYKGLKNQNWTYDLNHHMWFNNYSKNSLEAEEAAVSAPAPGQNVVTNKIDVKSQRMRFRLAPCK